MLFPPIETRAFPGNREDAYRAGMTPRIRCGTIDISIGVRPMRIVSLLASGTEIVCALGAGNSLVGRSHECDSPEWVRALPQCSEPAFDVNGSSADIDREVKRRLREGQPLYTLHHDLIRELRPDIILAQIHCEVCAVTPNDVNAMSGARIVPLSAFCVD